MDTHYNTLRGTTDNIVITQFNSLNPGSNDIFTYIDYEEDLATGEQLEGHYCPLPPYCLIEDKHKYIAS
ncbi:hypothetical protein [Kaarinaea lacus]